MINLDVGKYIKRRRKLLGLTQKDLAEKFNVSFQAISKWEKGETFPDTSLLLDLAEALETTVDTILRAGEYIPKQTKTIDVKDIYDGICAFLVIKRKLGDTLFYKGAFDGVSKIMNFNFDESFDKQIDIERLYTEAILQLIDQGYTIDIEDVKKIISHEEFYKYIDKWLKKNQMNSNSKLK